MPCYDPRVSPTYTDIQKYQNEIRILRQKVDKLTAMLCAQCRVSSFIHADVVDWWKVHKAWDIERGEYEVP